MCIKKTVGYIRVSTVDQATEGHSLEAQEEIILKYCDYQNLELTKIFKDEGISGKNKEDRKDLMLMLEYIRNNYEEIDYLITYSISRLARNTLNLLEIVEELKSLDINVYFVSDNVDTKTEVGRFMIQILAAVAEMERYKIIEQSLLGMNKNASEGGWNGGNVFGYKSAKKSKLEINKEQAEVIKKIFNLYTNEKWGLKKIAIYLNNRNIKTLKGKNWSAAQVAKILDNVVLAGFIRWTFFKNTKKEEKLIIKGQHEAIINEEFFNKTQKIRKSKSRTRGRIYNGDFLLSGLLKCANCNASMHGFLAHRGNNRYYRCSVNSVQGAKMCSEENISSSLSADKIEAEVLKKITKILQNENILKAIIKKINKKDSKDIKILVEEQEHFKKELKKLKRQKEEIFELKKDNQINFEELKEYLQYINNDYDKIKKQIEKVNIEIESSSMKIDENKVIKIFNNKIKNILESDDIEVKKMLLNSIIKEITINKSEDINKRTVKKIVLYFEPEEILALSSSSFIKNDVASDAIAVTRSNFISNNSHIHITI